MGPGVKAITLYQPWASAVALGYKTIETRSWPTRYRGPLAIHAGRNTAAVGAPIWDELARLVVEEGKGMYPLGFPTGAVLATCTLSDVVPIVRTGEEGAIRTLDVDGNGSLWLVEPRTYPDLRDVSVDVRSEYLAGGDYTDPAAWEEFCDLRGLAHAIENREIEEQRPYGDFTPGRYAWLLQERVELEEPQPARGRQGLWDWQPA